MRNNIIPPKAKIVPKELEIHKDIRTDDYFWLNDRENPEVIEYLNAENTYCDEMMSHTDEFQKSLFEEMKGRIKEDDASVPYKYNGYWYIIKFEKGKDYPIYVRKKETLDANEELLFDCNEMAKEHAYFKLSGISISTDNTKAAFAIDTVSRRQYTIQIKDLVSGEIYADEIKNTTGGSTWANDNKTLFYTSKDPQTLRADKIYKHKLYTSVKEDVLVYEELDDTFSVTIYKSKSRKYLIISSYSTLTNEYQILEADTPDTSFRVFQPRKRGLEYSISHYNDSFYIVTNANNAINFKLMKTDEINTSIINWKEVVAHREDVLLEGIDIFKDFLVISERYNGLNEIKIHRWDSTESYYLPFNNETYTAYTSINVDFDTTILRYGYNSLTTPSSVIDFDMVTKTKEIKRSKKYLVEILKKKTTYLKGFGHHLKIVQRFQYLWYTIKTQKKERTLLY